MANVTHWAHIYNRHKAQVDQGKKFLTRLPARQYKHSIDTNGWFDRMSCTLDVRPEDIMDAIDPLHGWIMREVNVIVDNPAVPIWEGYISRITAHLPNGTATVGIDSFANRISVQYTTSAGGTNANAFAVDADSVKLFGDKTHFYDMGDLNGAATALTDNIRDVLAERLKHPQISFARGQNADIRMEIECEGVYHTLEWEIGYSTTTTANQAWACVSVFVHTGWGAGADFTGFNSSTNGVNTGDGVFYYDPNGASLTPKHFDVTPVWSHNYEKLNGESNWEKILKIAEGGDGSGNLWRVGIMPSDINDSNRRRPYYLPLNETVEYIVRAFGDGRIRDKYGGVVSPWDVTPDRMVRISDILPGYDPEQPAGDPRELYIKRIEYDADARQGRGDISWATNDDTSIDEIFQQHNQGGQFITKRNTKAATGRRFF